jgi:prepilin-type processing-associated H-X9-DG protein
LAPKAGRSLNGAQKSDTFTYPANQPRNCVDTNGLVPVGINPAARFVFATSTARSLFPTSILIAYAYPGLPSDLYLQPDYDACTGEIPKTFDNGSANYCKYGWGSFHAANLIQFVYCDGHVGSVPMTIDPIVFSALSTIAGGEVIPDF